MEEMTEDIKVGGQLTNALRFADDLQRLSRCGYGIGWKESAGWNTGPMK